MVEETTVIKSLRMTKFVNTYMHVYPRLVFLMSLLKEHLKSSPLPSQQQDLVSSLVKQVRKWISLKKSFAK